MTGLRAILLTVLLAVVAAAGGAWLCARYVVHRSAPPSFHEVVHHDLNLSTEQERRLDTTRQLEELVERLEHTLQAVGLEVETAGNGRVKV